MDYSVIADFCIDPVFLSFFYCFDNQATGYAVQHIPVPVQSQDELGGLRQEGHPV